MFPIIAKMLLPLLAPLGWGLGLCCMGFLLYLRGRRVYGQGCILLGITLLLVFSNPLVGDALLGALEREYEVSSAVESPNADAIVVLGGVTVPPVSPRVEVEITGGGDRLLHGLRLYRAGKAPVLVFSGGALTQLTGSTMSEAQQFLRLTVESGVDSAVVVLEGDSRNTYENALYTRQILEKRGWREVLLVTSASHMRRAVAAFRTQGIVVIPAPTDIRVVARDFSLLQLLPTVAALEKSSIAIKEYIGWWIYGIRGWIR
ncbi:MAG: YdcF family protein [Gemmatimonadetes bacterium]|nr:YdcF family protein [Gemmatimonadota bacterium]